MAQAWTTYLLRYGEIGIKSRQVRNRFEKQLVRNLEAHFERATATGLVERSWGRIWLDSPDEQVARHAISHTFGLVSGSPCIVVEAKMDEIKATLARIAPHHLSPGQSFAIRARRTGQHPFTSQDVGREGGSAVWKAVDDLSVDLDEPDVELFVEVRNDKAYIFTEIIDGPGGLPMGSQGTVVVPIMGPRSPAAAWLAMRRGASVHALVPDGCQDVVRTLEPWAPGLRYTAVEGPVSRQGLIQAAAALADRIEAGALVLDDHERRALSPLAIDTPILRPLAGLPGKRWPQGAYHASKQAAKDHPAACVDDAGSGPEATVAALDEGQTARL